MKKSEWKRGYKIVAKVGQHYESATTLGRVVRYSTKTITKRPSRCGPLTCFESERDAECFRLWMEKLWGNDRKFVLKRCRHLEAARPRGTWLIWKPGRGSLYLPRGTVLADQIQLMP